VVTAFMRFLPTLAIYAVMHAIAGLPVGPHLLWAIPIFAMIAIFASGVAMLFAAAQVYFRDLSSFLPYVTRIWLYASPVLYYAEEVPGAVQADTRAQPSLPAARVVERRAQPGTAAERRPAGVGTRLGARGLRGRWPVLHIEGARVCRPSLTIRGPRRVARAAM
jgi:ABC-type polysaccharide/polyol phosphate export systems, permease component